MFHIDRPRRYGYQRTHGGAACGSKAQCRYFDSSMDSSITEITHIDVVRVTANLMIDTEAIYDPHNLAWFWIKFTADSWPTPKDTPGPSWWGDPTTSHKWEIVTQLNRVYYPTQSGCIMNVPKPNPLRRAHCDSIMGIWSEITLTEGDKAIMAEAVPRFIHLEDGEILHPPPP